MNQHLKFLWIGRTRSNNWISYSSQKKKRLSCKKPTIGVLLSKYIYNFELWEMDGMGVKEKFMHEGCVSGVSK